ncbi:MAG: hypothetical protein PHU56_03970 [Candidatus Pacebacteria bacterium]|nr:hypothetical protein [Candidatus Paceibacterota bacterium]
MNIFGLELPKDIDRLPPKIWRAVMLWIYGLPVTQYVVKDMGVTPDHEITYIILDRLRKSSAGIIVRTIAMEDKKRSPYFWIKEASDVRSVVASVFREKQPYLMAFAPRATPKKANGYIVGRYILEPNGARTLEFVAGAIEPRKLEKISATSAEYGLVRKDVGHVFNVIKDTADNYPCAAVIGELLRHEENLILLKEKVLKEKASYCCLCAEFTYWGGYNNLEFHDFDFRNDSLR